MQKLTLLAFATSALLLASTAQAHSDHDHGQDSKQKPETCEQLADAKNFSVDPKDPDTKALIERCGKKKSDSK